jgi:hypothetical protein
MNPFVNQANLGLQNNYYFRIGIKLHASQKPWKKFLMGLILTRQWQMISVEMIFLLGKLKLSAEFNPIMPEIATCAGLYWLLGSSAQICVVKHKL